MKLATVSDAITHLTSQIEAPFFLLDLDGIRTTFLSYRRVWSHLFEGLEIAFSFKTNPLRDVTCLLESLGAAAEVTTEEELDWALADRYSPQRITLGGPGKSDKLLERALQLCVNIHFDSVYEYGFIKERLDTRNGSILGPRLAHILPCGHRSRFGLTAGEIEAIRCSTSHRLDLINGLHIHVGSNLLDASIQLKALADYLPQIHSLTRMTNLPFRISLGGGYPSLPISHASDVYLLDNFVSPIYDFLTLSGLCGDMISFMIEPGRSIVQSHGFLVGSVLDVKWRNEKILLFLDIGTTMLPSSGQRPLRIRSLTESLAPASYRCCGPQCFESDYLGCLVAGNSTPIRGHRIIVEDVGAYDLTTAAIWSRIGPPIFGYIDGTLREISRAGRLPQL